MDACRELELGDGAQYRFAGRDEVGGAILARMAEAMMLEPCDDPAGATLVSVAVRSAWETGFDRAVDGLRATVFDPHDSIDLLAIQMAHVAAVIVLDAERRGGLFLHGALAERDGRGVILAGPGMVGKSTASRRMPPRWRSLCDDSTLVVRDPGGRFWAHPWPTWSRFMFGGSGGRWDVQHAVPLHGLFFLEQAGRDWAESVGAGRAATLLVESAKQAAPAMQRRMEVEELRRLRLQRFDNICAVAKAVPCFELHISLTGPFWEEIERVLDSDKGR